MHRLLPRALRAALLAVLLPATAAAQAADSTAPGAAPAVLVADPFVAVVTTPGSRAWLAAHDDAARMARACAPGVPADSTASIWDDFDARIPADSPLVVISVGPLHPTPPGRCAARAGRAAWPGRRGTAQVVAGVMYVATYAYDRYEDVEDVALERGMDSTPPFAAARRRVRLVFTRPAHGSPSTPSQVRLYLPPNAFGPDSAGGFPAMTLRITGIGTPPTELPLSDSLVRALWFGFLPQRIAGATAAPPAPLAVAPARDRVVRRAVSAYRAGDARTAALTLARRIYVTRDVAPADFVQAHAVLALSLLALGDSLDARPVLHDLYAAQPCFTLARGAAPAGTLAAFEARRPVADTARCTADVSRMTASSLLVPGLGQMHEGRRGRGITIASVTLATVGFAAVQELLARSTYNRYHETTSGAAAAALWQQAESQHDRARTVFYAGAALWAFNVLDAWLRESHHAERLRAVQDYGARPLAGVDPRTGAATLGLAIAF